MKSVTVILTTYNSSGTLLRTLSSISNQEGAGSQFRIELLVIDDCSTDGTQEILRACGVNFHSTPSNTGGPNVGRNIGLRKATGDYICFIDHDDVWHPEKIRRQMEVASAVPIVSSGYRVIDYANHRTVSRCSDSPAPIFFKKNETFLNILARSYEGQNAYFSTLMIWGEMKSIFFEEQFGMVDYDWYLNIFHNRNSAEIPMCLMTRYVCGSNLSLHKHYRMNDYLCSLTTLAQFEQDYSKTAKIGRANLNGSLARYFYVVNDMKSARAHFCKAPKNLKTLLYYMSTFAGSGLVKRYFHIFG